MSKNIVTDYDTTKKPTIKLQYQTDKGVKQLNIHLDMYVVRKWDDSIKIKFYQRGNRSWGKLTPTGKLKIPRMETMMYVNNKYFIQFNSPLSDKFKKQVIDIFKLMYNHGMDIDDIRDTFKLLFLKSNNKKYKWD